MLNIVKETIKYYTKNLKVPTINDINFDDSSLLDKKGSVFVTIYENGEIRGASGNIKEIKTSIVQELIENTVCALSKDSRFKPVKEDSIYNLKIRIDEITTRQILKQDEILKLDPVKNGVIVIKKDYEKMACILPNIDPKLLSGEDFIKVLPEKLKVKNFKEGDYIIYSIETKVTRD